MGSQFDGRVVLAQEAKVSADSTQLTQSVGTTAYTIDPPAGCLTVFLCCHPDNSGYLFIGEGSVSTTDWFAVVQAGGMISFNINPDNEPVLKLISNVAGQNVGILFGK